MSEKKPEPIYFPVPIRELCPVCGKVAYSLSGEHPQCAITRADAAFKARQKKRSPLSKTQRSPPLKIQRSERKQAPAR